MRVTSKMISLLEKIIVLQTKVGAIELDRVWRADLKDRAIHKSSLMSLLLERPNIDSDMVRSVGDLSDSLDRSFVLAEIDLRSNLERYFSNGWKSPDTLVYLHRGLENVGDSYASMRGKIRKDQDVVDIEYFQEDIDIVRYGFIPREIEEVFKIFDKEEVQVFLLAAELYLSLVKISPFNRGNLRLARIFIHGVFSVYGVNKQDYLVLEEYLIVNKQRYYSSLAATLNDLDNVEWYEFFLEALYYAFSDLVENIRLLSAGSINIADDQIIELTPRQKTILEIVKKNQQAGVSEIARLLGVSRQNIFSIMQKLINKKLVEKVGQGTTTRYKIKNM